MGKCMRRKFLILWISTTFISTLCLENFYIKNLSFRWISVQSRESSCLWPYIQVVSIIIGLANKKFDWIRSAWQYPCVQARVSKDWQLVIVLDWKVGRTCRTMGNWMATRSGIYVVSTLRSRSILPDTTPSSIQDAKSTSLQCKGGNSCWWRITSCCKNCQQIDKNCQQIDNLTCSWELQGTSLFHTTGIPQTTRWRLNNIVGSGPCNLGYLRSNLGKVNWGRKSWLFVIWRRSCIASSTTSKAKKSLIYIVALAK